MRVGLFVVGLQPAGLGGPAYYQRAEAAHHQRENLMAKEPYIREQVTWIGWNLKPDGMPFVQTIGSFFEDRGQQRTTRYDVLRERAWKTLQGRHYVRWQLMGYCRLDSAEFAEIDTFLEMALGCRLLPDVTRLAEYQYERNPPLLGLDNKPVTHAGEMVKLTDRATVGVYEHLTGRAKGHDFHVLHADLVTLQGLENMRDTFHKFKRL